MTRTTISQWWDNNQHGARRVWSVHLTVTGTDLTADEIAFLEPVVQAIQAYSTLLATGTETDDAYEPLSDEHLEAEEWESMPPPRKRSEKRRLSSIVSVRFSPAEADEMRRRATRQGMTMSGYLRWLALQPETVTNSITRTMPTSAVIAPSPSIETETDDA